MNIRKPKRRQTIFKKTPKKLCQLSEMKKISMNVPKSSRFVVKQKKMLSSTCDISEAGKKTVTKSLTTPISPNFRIDKRMQLSKQQLSTEEILMKRLETEKQEEAEKSQKAKKLYLRIKMQSDQLKLKNKQSESNDVTTNCTKSKKIFLRPKVLSYYKENASTKTLDNCTAAEIAMNFLHNTRSNGVTTIIYQIPNNIFILHIYNIYLYFEGTSKCSSKNNSTIKSKATYQTSRRVYDDTIK